MSWKIRTGGRCVRGQCYFRLYTPCLTVGGRLLLHSVRTAGNCHDKRADLPEPTNARVYIIFHLLQADGE